jgi:hypothetical protein
VGGECDELEDAAFAGAGDAGDDEVAGTEFGVEELGADGPAGDEAADAEVAAGGGQECFRAGEGDAGAQRVFLHEADDGGARVGAGFVGEEEGAGAQGADEVAHVGGGQGVGVGVGDDVGDFAAGVGVVLGLFEVGAGHDAAGAGGPLLPCSLDGVGVEVGGCDEVDDEVAFPGVCPVLEGDPFGGGGPVDGGDDVFGDGDAGAVGCGDGADPAGGGGVVDGEVLLFVAAGLGVGDVVVPAAGDLLRVGERGWRQVRAGGGRGAGGAQFGAAQDAA